MLCYTLQWHDNKRDGPQITGVSIVTQPFVQAQIKENMKVKLSVTGLCDKKSPVTIWLSARRTSDEENASIWWRHHETWYTVYPSHMDYITSEMPG